MVIQATLKGVWTDKLDGCPHLHKAEGPYRCEMMDMTACAYELGDTCSLFQEILREWKENAS